MGHYLASVSTRAAKKTKYVSFISLVSFIGCKIMVQFYVIVKKGFSHDLKDVLVKTDSKLLNI